MKILVAGAGGFIGGHLVRNLLSEGHDLVCADLKPIEFEKSTTQSIFSKILGFMSSKLEEVFCEEPELISTECINSYSLELFKTPIRDWPILPKYPFIKIFFIKIF